MRVTWWCLLSSSPSQTQLCVLYVNNKWRENIGRSSCLSVGFSLLGCTVTLIQSWYITGKCFVFIHQAPALTAVFPQTEDVEDDEEDPHPLAESLLLALADLLFGPDFTVQTQLRGGSSVSTRNQTLCLPSSDPGGELPSKFTTLPRFLQAYI